jgi:hypothetical protein
MNAAVDSDNTLAYHAACHNAIACVKLHVK